jgi:sorbitol-specific phosphotransferase system component IIBC
MVLWLLSPTQQFSFVKFPFLIPLAAKDKVLRVTSQQHQLIQMTTQVMEGTTAIDEFTQLR